MEKVKDIKLDGPASAELYKSASAELDRSTSVGLDKPISVTLDKSVLDGVDKSISVKVDKSALGKDDGRLKLSENALRVLERRYLKKDKNGRVLESPEDMFRRVARTIAEADRIYDPQADVQKVEEEFYRLMTRLEFMPNSPTLMNAGRELGQLAACFVLPVEDSMDSIFEAIKNTALIHKSGGGTGFSFSHIRPKNDAVQSTRGVSSGPLSFMSVFDAATETIKQGGTRRGANIGILRVDHPDIMDFIVAKHETDALSNFNISVGITEDFMEAVEKDREYNLVNPRNGEVVQRLKARTVYDKIVEMAWKTGDPGIVFLDRLDRDNPTPHVGKIESTNPCGEQPLLPYESCNLGSINLAKVVENGGIDYGKLKQIVWSAVHFLDNVIDANRYPLPRIKKMTRGNRKIGLGVMGFADMLVRLGVPYESKEALGLASKVMRFIRDESRKASVSLAEEREVFPNFKGSVFDGPKGIKLRNATTTTIAPTGTISIIAGCSSGVEPIFALAYTRNVMDDDKLPEINQDFERIAKEKGFYSEKLMKNIAKEGSVRNCEEVPQSIKRLFATAHDIPPEWHIEMQAAFQRFVDNAVSKTVNVPENAGKEVIDKIFKLACKNGCKGVTIYRDGSKEKQVLTLGKSGLAGRGSTQTGGRGEEVRLRILPRPRPLATYGMTRRVETGCGDLYVTINKDDKGLPFEIFNSIGKAGGCSASQSEAIGRLVSLALRSDIEPEAVIKHLKGISCHKPRGLGKNKVLSCADAIARALEENLKTDHHNIAEVTFTRGACPECGGVVEPEGGCIVCRSCGYSECE